MQNNSTNNMRTNRHFFVYIFVFIYITSCTLDNDLHQRMREIKSIGDSNPDSALILLDSLSESIINTDECTRQKFNLLTIRLQDKAYIIPQNSNKIDSIVQYYEKDATCAEKQEAYYYAGSVYRDLNDTPNALIYFLKSVDCAEGKGMCDSIMLRNA